MSGKDAVTELREHAQWLRDMMAATRTSLNKAVRDWDLGSKRTFARILDGQMEEADAAEWRERYRAARRSTRCRLMRR